jgi:hypothetical protein
VVTDGHDYHTSFYRVFEHTDFRVNLRPHARAFETDLRKRVDVLVFTTWRRPHAELRTALILAGPKLCKLT